MPHKQSVNNVDSIDDIETEVANLKILIQALEFDVDNSPFTTAEDCNAYRSALTHACYRIACDVAELARR